MKTFSVSLPEDLPPVVALALFETLENLSNAVWNLYRTDLIELMTAESDQIPSTQQAFDFNDDLPF
jgi:hypothetical protein